VTHLGAFCVFVYLLLHRLWPEAPWLYYTSISSLVVCMLNSVLYHTFMNMTAHYDTWLLVRRHRLLWLLGAQVERRVGGAAPAWQSRWSIDTHTRWCG
jgi:predicted membrane channel-forming protein YqfA (hemolysin III family)